MSTSDKARGVGTGALDLPSIIRASGIWTDKQLADVAARIKAGDLPPDATALADRLMRENQLTEYQVRRLLANKPGGLVIGKYVILDRIGSGSMGRVYKAHHPLMGRDVAVKVIAPEILSNERAKARFQREMKLVGRLDHPNVVRAFDADGDKGVLFIVMEYVSGRSLGQMLLSHGPLPPVDVVNYAAQAALGLGHAHAQGVVHRDVKPSNLLVNDEKQVKVLDLGLGVLMDGDSSSTFATADGIAVGTVDYMSPEQACGQTVDGRSDLFSLGCSMYHLITGRQAFPADSPIERLGKRIKGRPHPITDLRPDLPQSLVAVLDKLMATNPADRYQKAEDAAEALSALIRPKKPASAKAAPKPVASPPPPPAPSDVEATALPVSTIPGPPPEIAIVAPAFPAWFRPLADLASTAPTAAILAVAGVLATTFALGFLVGRLF